MNEASLLLAAQISEALARLGASMVALGSCFAPNTPAETRIAAIDEARAAIAALQPIPLALEKVSETATRLTGLASDAHDTLVSIEAAQ